MVSYHRLPLDRVQPHCDTLSPFDVINGMQKESKKILIFAKMNGNTALP